MRPVWVPIVSFGRVVRVSPEPAVIVGASSVAIHGTLFSPWCVVVAQLRFVSSRWSSGSRYMEVLVESNESNYLYFGLMGRGWGHGKSAAFNKSGCWSIQADGYMYDNGSGSSHGSRVVAKRWRQIGRSIAARRSFWRRRSTRWNSLWASPTGSRMVRPLIRVA